MMAPAPVQLSPGTFLFLFYCTGHFLWAAQESFYLPVPMQTPSKRGWDRKVPGPLEEVSC